MNPWTRNQSTAPFLAQYSSRDSSSAAPTTALNKRLSLRFCKPSQIRYWSVLELHISLCVAPHRAATYLTNVWGAYNIPGPIRIISLDKTPGTSPLPTYLRYFNFTFTYCCLLQVDGLECMSQRVGRAIPW